MSGSGFRGRGFGLRGARPNGPANAFVSPRFPFPKFNHPRPPPNRLPGPDCWMERPGGFAPWQQNANFPHPKFRGNLQFRPNGRGRPGTGNNRGLLRFSGPGRPPFPMGLVRPPIRHKVPVLLEGNVQEKPQAAPQAPLLGSEEERQQKISEAADKLKQKLSSITEEDLTEFWEDDLSVTPSKGTEDKPGEPKGIPGLLHEPPELDLTFTDFRDIGRVDFDNSKLDSVENIGDANDDVITFDGDNADQFESTNDEITIINESTDDCLEILDTSHEADTSEEAVILLESDKGESLSNSVEEDVLLVNLENENHSSLCTNLNDSTTDASVLHLAKEDTESQTGACSSSSENITTLVVTTPVQDIPCAHSSHDEDVQGSNNNREPSPHQGQSSKLSTSTELKSSAANAQPTNGKLSWASCNTTDTLTTTVCDSHSSRAPDGDESQQKAFNGRNVYHPRMSSSMYHWVSPHIGKGFYFRGAQRPHMPRMPPPGHVQPQMNLVPPMFDPRAPPPFTHNLPPGSHDSQHCQIIPFGSGSMPPFDPSEPPPNIRGPVSRMSPGLEVFNPRHQPPPSISPAVIEMLQPPPPPPLPPPPPPPFDPREPPPSITCPTSGIAEKICGFNPQQPPPRIHNQDVQRQPAFSPQLTSQDQSNAPSDTETQQKAEFSAPGSSFPSVQRNVQSPQSFVSNTNCQSNLLQASAGQMVTHKIPLPPPQSASSPGIKVSPPVKSSAETERSSKGGAVTLEDGLEDMQEAMEFAKQIMSMSTDSGKVQRPTISVVSAQKLGIRMPNEDPNDSSQFSPSSQVSAEPSLEPSKIAEDILGIGARDSLSGPHSMPGTPGESTDQISKEHSAQVQRKPAEELPLAIEQLRPKVMFNLNSRSRRISKVDDWYHQNEEYRQRRQKSSEPTDSARRPEEEKTQRDHSDRKRNNAVKNIPQKQDTRDHRPPDPLLIPTPEKSSETSTKVIESSSTTPIPAGKPKRVIRKLGPATPESTWKTKVINRFLKMSKNDIYNMVNNSSLRKFDIAMKHLVKERRTSLALEIRNTEDERMREYDREEFMNQLNAMLDPGAEVDITNLPTEFIHHLSEVLQLDSTPFGSEFCPRPDGEVIELGTLHQTDSILIGDDQAEDMIRAVMDQQREQMMNPSFPEELCMTNLDELPGPNNIPNVELDCILSKVQDEPSGRPARSTEEANPQEEPPKKQQPLFNVADLDDILSEVTAKTKQGPKGTSQEYSRKSGPVEKRNSSSKRSESGSEKSYPAVSSRLARDGSAPRITKSNRSTDSDCNRSRKSTSEDRSTYAIGKYARWSRKEREDLDTFRNLTKEEWEAKYGRPKNVSVSSSGRRSNSNSSDNSSHRERRHHQRHCFSDSPTRQSISPLVREPTTNLEKHSSQPKESREATIESDSTITTGSSSSSDSDDQQTVSADVTKLLKVIKENEKIGKQRSLNETIRDEVAAEIEKSWREKDKYKERKLSKQKRRREGKLKYTKDHHRRKKVKPTEPERREENQLLIENEIKKETVIKEEPNTVSEDQITSSSEILNPESFPLISNPIPEEPTAERKQLTVEANRQTTSAPIVIQTEAQGRSGIVTTTIQPKTKAQLKQMPELERESAVENVEAVTTSMDHDLTRNETCEVTSASTKQPKSKVTSTNSTLTLSDAVSPGSASDNNKTLEATPVVSSTVHVAVQEQTEEHSRISDTKEAHPESLPGPVGVAITESIADNVNHQSGRAESVGSKRIDIKVYKERTLQKRRKEDEGRAKDILYSSANKSKPAEADHSLITDGQRKEIDESRTLTEDVQGAKSSRADNPPVERNPKEKIDSPQSTNQYRKKVSNEIVDKHQERDVDRARYNSGKELQRSGGNSMKYKNLRIGASSKLDMISKKLAQKLKAKEMQSSRQADPKHSQGKDERDYRPEESSKFRNIRSECEKELKLKNEKARNSSREFKRKPQQIRNHQHHSERHSTFKKRDPFRRTEKEERPGHEKVERPSHEDGERPGHEKEERPSHAKEERPGHEKEERPGHEKEERPSHEKEERPSHEKEERPSHGKEERPSHEKEERQKPSSPSPGTEQKPSRGKNIANENQILGNSKREVETKTEVEGTSDNLPRETDGNSKGNPVSTKEKRPIKDRHVVKLESSRQENSTAQNSPITSTSIDQQPGAKEKPDRVADNDVEKSSLSERPCNDGADANKALGLEADATGIIGHVTRANPDDPPPDKKPETDRNPEVNAEAGPELNSLIDSFLQEPIKPAPCEELNKDVDSPGRSSSPFKGFSQESIQNELCQSSALLNLGVAETEGRTEAGNSWLKVCLKGESLNLKSEDFLGETFTRESIKSPEHAKIPELEEERPILEPEVTAGTGEKVEFPTGTNTPQESAESNESSLDEAIKDSKKDKLNICEPELDDCTARDALEGIGEPVQPVDFDSVNFNTLSTVKEVREPEIRENGAGEKDRRPSLSGPIPDFSLQNQCTPGLEVSERNEKADQQRTKSSGEMQESNRSGSELGSKSIPQGSRGESQVDVRKESLKKLNVPTKAALKESVETLFTPDSCGTSPRTGHRRDAFETNQTHALDRRNHETHHQKFEPQGENAALGNLPTEKVAQKIGNAGQSAGESQKSDSSAGKNQNKGKQQVHSPRSVYRKDRGGFLHKMKNKPPMKHKQKKSKRNVSPAKAQETLNSGMVQLKHPVSKEGIMARMIEIDVEIHKLMTEKMTLYQMLETGALVDNQDKSLASEDKEGEPVTRPRTPSALMTQLIHNIEVNPTPSPVVRAQTKESSMNDEERGTETKVQKQRASKQDHNPRKRMFYSSEDEVHQGNGESLKKSSKKQKVDKVVRWDQPPELSPQGSIPRDVSIEGKSQNDAKSAPRNDPRLETSRETVPSPTETPPSIEESRTASSADLETGKKETPDNFTQPDGKTPHNKSTNPKVRGKSKKGEVSEQRNEVSDKQVTGTTKRSGDPNQGKSQRKRIREEQEGAVKEAEPSSLEPGTNLGPKSVESRTSENLSIYSDDSTWDSFLQHPGLEPGDQKKPSTGLALLEETFKKEMAKARAMKAHARKKKKKKQLQHLLRSVNTLTSDEEELPLSTLYIKKLQQKKDLLDSLEQRNEENHSAPKGPNETDANRKDDKQADVEQSDGQVRSEGKAESSAVTSNDERGSEVDQEKVRLKVCSFAAERIIGSASNSELETTEKSDEVKHETVNGAKRSKIGCSITITNSVADDTRESESLTPIENNDTGTGGGSSKPSRITEEATDERTISSGEIIRDQLNELLKRPQKSFGQKESVQATQPAITQEKEPVLLASNEDQTEAGSTSGQELGKVVPETISQEAAKCLTGKLDSSSLRQETTPARDSAIGQSPRKESDISAEVSGDEDYQSNGKRKRKRGSSGNPTRRSSRCVEEMVKRAKPDFDSGNEQEPQERNLQVSCSLNKTVPVSGEEEAESTSGTRKARGVRKSQSPRKRITFSDSEQHQANSLVNDDNTDKQSSPVNIDTTLVIKQEPSTAQKSYTAQQMMNCKVRLVDSKYTILKPDISLDVLRKHGISSINSCIRPSQPVTEATTAPTTTTTTTIAIPVTEGTSGKQSLPEEEKPMEGQSTTEQCGPRSKKRTEKSVSPVQIEKTKPEIDIIHVATKEQTVDISDDCRDKPDVEIIKEEMVIDDGGQCPDNSSSTVSVIEGDDNERDKEPARTQYTVHKGPILDIKVFGNSFLAASEDGTVYRYSQASNGILNIYKGHSSAVTCLYVYTMESADISKELMFSGSLDGTLRCYNIMTGGQMRKPADVGSPVQCMDQAWGVIFVGTKSGHVSRYHIKSGLIKGESIQFSEKSVLALKATNEGPRKVLIVASRSQPITIRDAQSGLFLRTICGQKSHTVYSLMRHNNFIYCGTSSTSILVFDFTNGEQTMQYDAGVGIVCMRLYQHLLFAGCYDGNIYVFNTKDHRLICSIPGPGNMLLSMEIVDNKIIAGSKDKRLQSWHMPKQVRALFQRAT